MPTFKYNVTRFNKYVNNLNADLQSRGETAPGLINHLFQAYRTVTDNAFGKYIAHKHNAYEEG